MSLKKKHTSYFKDYNFSEWQALPYETKRDIWNNFWSPYKPELGKLTRDSIIEEFKQQNPKLVKKSIAIGFGYFGWNVGCIYVVVQDSSIRIPKEFASVFVNKGVVCERVDEQMILVNWRYGGSKAEFKIRE